MKTPLWLWVVLLGLSLLPNSHVCAQQPAPSPSADQTDSLEIVSISPKSPAVLKVGEKIQVTVRYRLSSSEEARVSVSPSTRVRLQRGVCSTQSASVSHKGNGELVVSFYLKEPATATGIRVLMADDKARKVIKSASLPIQAEWRAEDAQAATSTPKTPDSPASKAPAPTRPQQLANTGGYHLPAPTRESLPTKPILRIETGMHIDEIMWISTDARNRFLVTGSDDGTIRLWLMSTGELVRVLRPPYAPGTKSVIRHYAMSPDGNTIAREQESNGVTLGLAEGGVETSKCFTVYLFDRSSGAIASKIEGFHDEVRAMTFSKDSRYLAVQTLKSLKIFRAPDYAEVTSIKENDCFSKSVDFSPNGQLVTGCSVDVTSLFRAR